MNAKFIVPESLLQPGIPGLVVQVVAELCRFLPGIKLVICID
jgi:hypothetical protein